jgi:hypothetical protein
MNKEDFFPGDPRQSYADITSNTRPGPWHAWLRAESHCLKMRDLPLAVRHRAAMDCRMAAHHQMQPITGFKRYTPEEREAVLNVFAEITALSQFFRKRDVESRYGLLKCILRTYLFIVEEYEADRYLPTETMYELIVSDFHEDQSHQ